SGLVRTLWYRQVALDYKHDLPVLTVLMLLRKEANSPTLGDFRTIPGDLRLLDLGRPLRNSPQRRRPTSYTPVFVRKTVGERLRYLPSRLRSPGYEVLRHSEAR